MSKVENNLPDFKNENAKIDSDKFYYWLKKNQERLNLTDGTISDRKYGLNGLIKYCNTNHINIIEKFLKHNDLKNLKKQMQDDKNVPHNWPDVIVTYFYEFLEKEVLLANDREKYYNINTTQNEAKAEIVDLESSEDLHNNMTEDTDTTADNKDVSENEDVHIQDENNRKISKELAEMSYLHSNTIFYGVPGCGKSYKIKELLHLTKDCDTPLNKKFYKRILFHPEYSYSDFVGQVMPKVDENDKIKYKFRAGPFVEILKDALIDSDNNYFLIIEEINRGNAPAIFGDIFQLLDRNDEGKSEYSIYNKEIIDYLKKNKLKIEEVAIPENLTILATMNTSDQNVFTLDTAFKRRWRMTRIENNFEYEKDEKGKIIEGPAKNKILKATIETPKATYIWKEFAENLNETILAQCNDGIIAEDKLLGTYFVKKKELENSQVFAEKIFMYLWNDVVKYNKAKLFKPEYKTLDKVIDKFVEGENVFNEQCSKMKECYDKATKNKLPQSAENENTEVTESEKVNE